jgi:hypothetical protein
MLYCRYTASGPPAEFTGCSTRSWAVGKPLLVPRAGGPSSQTALNCELLVAKSELRNWGKRSILLLLTLPRDRGQLNAMMPQGPQLSPKSWGLWLR